MRPHSPVSAAMFAVVGLALTGCLDTTGLDDTHNPGPVTTPTGQVSGVALNVLTATMHVGDAFTPSAVVRDEHGIPVSGQPVNWYTTDTTVASVNGGGTIVAHRSGKVQISAALDKYSAMMVLDVAPPVTSPIILAPEQLSTLAGTAVTLQINDAGGAVVPTGTVVWTSSSPQVANIDYNGVVTARAAGTTIITATNDGSTAASQVTVSPAGILTLENRSGSIGAASGSLRRLGPPVTRFVGRHGERHHLQLGVEQHGGSHHRCGRYGRRRNRHGDNDGHGHAFGRRPNDGVGCGDGDRSTSTGGVGGCGADQPLGAPRRNGTTHRDRLTM